jgi:hypothetical protein
MENSTNEIKDSPCLHTALSFWAPWAIIFLVGAFLRLYLIDDQIILDDEWHGIDFALNNSPWYLLTHYTRLGATCIPLNLYCQLLLTSIGVSEVALLAPSITTGILSLLVFPLLAKSIFNTRTAIFFTCLLATSPLLIFYSRDGRPYSLYLFFGFLALFFLYFWTATGKHKYAYLYVAVGVFAIYLHLLAVVVVISPLLFLLFLTFIPIRDHESRQSFHLTLVTRAHYVLVLAAMVCALTLLMAYPLLHSLTPLNSGQTEFTLNSLAGLLSLLSGTSNKLFIVIFMTLLAYGYLHLHQSNQLLSVIFFTAFLGYLCALIISTPTMASVPIILARYVIPLFPVCYLIIAIGLVKLTEKMASSGMAGAQESWGNTCHWLLIVLCLAVPLWLGPLKTTYGQQNNFTNHSAFQESYTPFDWQTPRPSAFYMPFSRSAEEIPMFYKQLARDRQARKIIEYPMMAGNHFNPFYYYQHFHHKEVMAGFATSVKLKEKKSAGYIVGNYYIDFILGKAPAPARLRFKNIINIENLDEVKRSGASHLILHKNIISEMFPQISPDSRNRLHFGWARYPAIDTMINIYQGFCGSPQYEDKDIVVYGLDQQHQPQAGNHVDRSSISSPDAVKP